MIVLIKCRSSDSIQQERGDESPSMSAVKRDPRNGSHF